MSIVIETFSGDSAPNITFTISRDDGSIVDLTNTIVILAIQDPETGEVTNNPSGTITNRCNITNGPTGICTYAWNANGTDTPNPGLYPANIIIIYPDATRETYALKISVDNPIHGVTV